MASLPAVFVELKADASKFMAAMQSAQGELKKTADVAQTNNERMANVGKVAFAGIAAAAVGFGAVAVKAALDGQQAHAQLVQAVQNSGVAFESVGGRVDDMSGKFAKLGFENDNVEAALTRLVTASGNTKTAMDNMGLAADLARARHISLEDAAGSLGKILAGNMKGMQAFGLSAKDAAGNSLTTAAALQLLNDRFGGAAQANAGTYAGKLQALNAEWHNMVESVGNMLLPVLGSAAGVLADVAGFFERNQTVAAGMAGVIAGPLVAAMTIYIAKQAMAFGESVAATIGKVATAIFGIVPAVEAAAVAEEGMASATALATGGLSILGGLAGLAIAHFMGQSSAHKDATESAKGMKGAVDDLSGSEDSVSAAADAATLALKKQSDLFKGLFNDTNAQASEITKLIGDQQSLAQATKTLTGDTTAHTQAQQAATRATRESEDAQTKLTKATDTYNKLQAGVGQAISKDHVGLQHDLTQAQLSNEQAQIKVTEAVAQYGENSFEARQANLDLESSYITLQGAQDAMGTEGQDAWDKVNAAQDAMHQAQQDVIDKTNAQKDALDKMNKPVSDLAANTQAWQTAQNTLNTDWGTFEKTIGAHPELRDQLRDQLLAMKNNLPKGADTKPYTELLDKINALDVNKLAAAAFLAAAAKSGGPKMQISGPAPVVDDPKHPSGGWSSEITFAGGAAEGAMVKARPGGKLMLVGEGGQDEAIVPLDKMGSIGGGLTVNVHVYGSVVTERDLALTVRDRLLEVGRNMVGVGLGG